MIRLKQIVERINSIGLVDTDSSVSMATKNLVVYLALSMSIGALVWGSLLMYFKLTLAALIPFLYIVVSFVNILQFQYRKNFITTCAIQVTISTLLPFLLQWQLGGFFASGCVMLWSILSLIGSVILLRGAWVYPNLLLNAGLITFSYFFDAYFASLKPAILSSDASLLLLTLNILMIMSIVFLLGKIKVDSDTKIQQALEQLYAENEQFFLKEREGHRLLQASENRYRSLIEESRVMICTHDLKGYLTSLNKAGEDILEYDKNELLGTNIRSLLAPEFQIDFDVYLDQIAHSNAFENFMTVITKKGNKRVLLFRNTLLVEPGQQSYVLGSAQDVTEWRKTENRERKTTKELQLIVSSIDDFVIEFDEARRFKNFWCRDHSKLNRPTSYYIGKTLAEAFSYAPEFAHKANRVYDSVLISGKPFSIEIEAGILPSSLSYLIRLNPIQESDGSIKRCTALVSDITARKLTEKKLNQDHALLRTIIDNLPLNVYVKNTLSQKIIVNKAEWEYLGATNEGELLGKSDLDLYPDDSAQLSLAEDKLVLAGDSILGKETINKKKDGSHTYFISSKIPLRDANNEVIGLVGISINNTESKKRELELKRLSAIAEQTTNIVVTTNTEGKMSWVNTSFENVTGYKKEEAIGKKPSEILQGAGTSQDTVAYMRERIKHQAPFECELLNYRKSGQPYWIKISAQPLLDINDQFNGYFSLQQEVTKERQLIEELRFAKEEAEESNRLKTIFLGNLSHEVRTPLQGILGFAEILENPNLAESKRKEYLGIIKRRTGDMQNIIESLLDMASLETGEIKAFPGKVNLFESIEQMFKKTQQDFDFAGKHIELILDNRLEPTATAFIDPQHLLQVITNLFGNALKFTNEGSIVCRSEKLPTCFKVSIIDTGIGIPADKIDHIFEPFRQAHEGISRSKGGIGLGLAICKKMTQMWGGQIEAKAADTRGSIFSFTIPLENNESPLV